uniref:NADH-ubiquinone oxidoreductase chain 2 n=1 Tax=Aphaniotis fusca TaxID=89036 RepID=Q9G602_9SAUR|nr:NADH dehydrogenase subunit 2 [Aphaniotis fusca]AAL60076.1 NADH dehydrogenase subunit 2 [Aphaniotis fusca]
MQVLVTALTFMMIFIGTLIVSSSNSLLMAWLGLELNTFAILPLISKTKHPRSIEATTKYFITQATASCLLLFSGTVNAWQTGTWNISQPYNELSSMLMLIALMIKAGAVPTHFWLPEVMQGTTIMTAMIIATWQKIAPTILIFLLSNHAQPYIAITLGLLSTSFGGWGGMNQTQLRKMLAFSSIANMGWTMMTLTSDPKTSMFNIFIYILMTIPTFLLMMLTSTKTLQNMAIMWTTSPTMSMMMTIILLSMAGLPPLTGFVPKLMILNELVTQNLTTTAIITTMTSLLTLVFYLRITYLTTLLNPPSSSTSTTKWRQKINGTKMVIFSPTAMMTTPTLPTLIP